MSAPQAKALKRLETKARAQGGVCAPTGPWECWAEKRAYTGSAFPAFVQCAKQRRPGCLTCRWHHDREAAAQALSRSMTYGAS